MHWTEFFTARQTMWTLTFAALLLLLIVLLGRDRAKRFPLFTASLALYALRLLIEVLLTGRMAAIPLNEILLTLADVAALVSLGVLIELARRCFAGAGLRASVVATAVVVAASGAVAAFWGQAPNWKQLLEGTLLGWLRLMQFAAQKLNLFDDVATLLVMLLIVAVGGRFTGGWRSHAQKIAIGLGTVSAAWLGIQRAWQSIAENAHPHSQQEYEQLMGLGTKLVNANKVVYIAALVWWIFWLWREEGGAEIAEPATVDD